MTAQPISISITSSSSCYLGVGEAGVGMIRVADGMGWLVLSRLAVWGCCFAVSRILVTGACCASCKYNVCVGRRLGVRRCELGKRSETQEARPTVSRYRGSCKSTSFITSAAVSTVITIGGHNPGHNPPPLGQNPSCQWQGRTKPPVELEHNVWCRFLLHESYFRIGGRKPPGHIPLCPGGWRCVGDVWCVILWVLWFYPALPLNGGFWPGGVMSGHQ